MKTIIPYDVDTIQKANYIKPNGTYLWQTMCHESCAREYCLGEEYDLIHKILYYPSSDSDSLFEKYKKAHNYEGKKEDIDLYSSSHLTKEELEHFLLWEKEYIPYNCEYYSSFLEYYYNLY